MGPDNHANVLSEQGAKHNIISDEAKLQLTVRSYSDASRQQLLDSPIMWFASMRGRSRCISIY